MKPDIKQILKKVHVDPLTQAEHQRVWSGLYHSISSSSHSSSPIRLGFRPLLRKMVAFLLIFGMTATTAGAANGARPGDLLFPLDRAIEQIQLSLSSDAKRAELRVEFALERVEEVQEILAEIEADAARISVAPVSDPAPLTSDVVAVDAAPSETLEIATPAETDASDPIDTQSSAVVPTASSSPIQSTGTLALASPTPSTTTTVSREGTLKERDNDRIELALATALQYLGEAKASLRSEGRSDAVTAIDTVVASLNSHIEALPEDITFNVSVSSTDPSVEFAVASSSDQTRTVLSIRERETTQDSDGEIKHGASVLTQLTIGAGKISVITTRDMSPTQSVLASSTQATSTGPESLSELAVLVSNTGNKDVYLVTAEYAHKIHMFTATATDPVGAVDELTLRFGLEREAVARALVGTPLALPQSTASTTGMEIATSTAPGTTTLDTSAEEKSTSTPPSGLDPSEESISDKATSTPDTDSSGFHQNDENTSSTTIEVTTGGRTLEISVVGPHSWVQEIISGFRSIDSSTENIL